jgi:very-short-patch-repair endonuclease
MGRDFARQLRKNMTDAERRLWYHLKLRQFDGKRFRKQAPIGVFVVDFVCFESSLIVELDGGQHAAQVEHDEVRTAWLNSRGFRVLRFWNSQVFEELDAVLESIWNALQDTDRPCLSAETGRDPDLGKLG